MRLDTALATTDTPAPFHFTIPIAKVDEQRRLVRGVATSEALDAHGQIVDYDTAKAAFGSWVGNIREMHQPKAVGKRTAVEFDDVNRQIIVESYISRGAEDTWQKVLDGTLSMYSIGGEAKVVTDKVAPRGRLLMTSVVETSLVDSGACPTAKFDVVKTVDGQATDVQPDEPAEQPLETTDPLEAFVERFAAGTRAGDALAAAIVKMQAAPIEKRAYPRPDLIDRTLGCISGLEMILAEEFWMAQDGAGDEDRSTQVAQVQVLRNAIELVLAYLLSEFNAQFADLDAASLDAAAVTDVAMSRRASLAEAAAFALPIAFSKLDGTGQLWIAKAGARHSRTDTAMIQAMHDTALTLGAACSTEKSVGVAPIEKACEGCRQARERAALEQPREVPPATSDPEPPAAAAEPAIVLEPPSAEAVAALLNVDTEKAVALPAPTPDVHTIVKAAIAEALQAHQATSDATIAGLQTQIEKLRGEPQPGGPVARAVPAATPVHKSIGNSATTAEGDVDPALVTQFATELAKGAQTEAERSRIVENLIKFQHQSGAGAMPIRQTTGRPRTE